MNPLVVDFAKRMKWLFLIQFVATTSVWAQPRGMMIHLENLGPLLLFFNLMRGLARSCSALPISRLSIARGMWVAAVVLPTIVGSVAVLAGSCIHGTFSLVEWLQHTLIGLGLAGSALFLLTCLPTTQSTTPARSFRDAVIGSLWGLSMMSSMAFVFLGNTFLQYASTSLTTFIAVIMAVLATLSYGTTQRMVTARAMRPVLFQSNTSRTKPTIAETEVGWRLWLKMELNGQVLNFAMALGGGLFARMLTGALGVPAKPEMAFGQMSIFLIIATFVSFVFGAGALRAMRSLPISRDLLARLFLFRSIISVVNIWSAFQVVGFIFGTRLTIDRPTVLTVFCIGGTMSIIQAIALRFPHPFYGLVACFCTGPLILLYGATQSLGSQGYRYAGWFMLMIIFTYTVSFRLHRRWILTSSKIYRRPTWLARFTPAAGR